MKRCKAHGKLWCSACLVQTVLFPFEHFVWERAPIIKLFPPLLGIK